MANTHSLHIPVMGIGFTVDTPLKVSQFGIDSVMSLGNDKLLEKLRRMYSDKFQLPYQEISDKSEDFRAKRITSYLNLIKELADKKIRELRSYSTETIQEVKDYFHMLPQDSWLKQEFTNITSENFDLQKVKTWLTENLSMGSLDVNIMTKLDTTNYAKKEKLSHEFNDAHAALRGFANSNLNSSVVLSAGMNPRLYTYFENFEDFYPDNAGTIKKKIVVKVSDYRSALIQGKFFAKKGLWVSEYRIESGLNCGGHAFATDGLLIGPILEEFKQNKENLIQTLYELFSSALEAKSRVVPSVPLPIKITAQGGVGTAEEHDFLINNYNLDSVGWGSPFLLVPEVINIDDQTLIQLANAKEKDLLLSDVSPLGVPFNTLKNTSKEVEKIERIKKKKPGSACVNKYLVFNTEFTNLPICTASRQYQNLKIEELNGKKLDAKQHEVELQKITVKECLCTGLSNPALIVNKLEINKAAGNGVSVCPGPNIAYFSDIMSLKVLTDHIYGRSNVIRRKDRPHMFIKEFDIYLRYLNARIDESGKRVSIKQKTYLKTFVENLKNGREYYQNLIAQSITGFKDRDTLNSHLERIKESLKKIDYNIEKIKSIN